jgi:hypothetical protein
MVVKGVKGVWEEMKLFTSVFEHENRGATTRTTIRTKLFILARCFVL